MSDYEILINFPSNKEVSVEYPEDIINKNKSLKKVYKLEAQSIIVEDKVISTIKCPKYAQRLMIGFDIMFEVLRRRLRLIDYNFNGYKTRNIKGLIRKNLAMDRYHIVLEKELFTCFLESLLKEEIITPNQDISEGYKILVDLTGFGGIK
jgi:hypothetical protein